VIRIMAGINNNLIPAKRGEVRNPNGRTKGVPNNKTRIRRLLEMTSSELNPITNMINDLTLAEQLDLVQIKKALNGDTRAYIAIMDRFDGKPIQTTDSSKDSSARITVVIEDSYKTKPRFRINS
jgi:hypothetical protein